MTNLAEATIGKTLKINPKKKFNQPANDLIDLCITGTKETPAAAFMTLAFILRLPPDTVLTAKNISYEMQRRAERTGGKYKKPKTIRLEFGQLVKAGFMGSKLNKASHGGPLPTEYTINYAKIYGGHVEIFEGGVAENSARGKSHDKLFKTEEIDIKEGGAENSARVLYKERARLNNTNTSPVGGLSVSKQNPPVPLSRADFAAVAPVGLHDEIDDVLVNSLKKYFPDDPMGFFLKAINDEKINNPINWIWGAITKKRKPKNDIKKRQSLTQPLSTENQPPNPNKNLANQCEINETYASALCGINKRSQDESTNPRVKLVESGKIYTLEDGGFLLTEKGSYPIGQINTMLQNGTLVYV